MTGQHRAPRRLRDCIAEWLEHLGDRRVYAMTGDLGPQPYRPVVLDHVHQELDATGACVDKRCGYDLYTDPHKQAVRELPIGEPDWMPEARP